MAPNDIWMLTVRGLVTETDHYHTLHFRQNADSIGGPELIAAWNGAPGSAYRALFSTFVTPVLLIEAKIVASPAPFPSPDILVPATAAQLGTRSTAGADYLPAYVAACVTEKGTLAGRRYSGRFFLGGMIEPDVNANTITASYITLVNAYISALKTAFVTPPTPPWRLFAYSQLLGEGDPSHTRQDPNNPNARVSDPVAQVAPELAGSDVRDLILNPRPTTMRSRKYGHGS